jgi:selenocysteine lyase/cysteine desulfurase
MGIYADNACTTFPEPPCVAEAMTRFMTEGGYNVNRGSYGGAFDAEDGVLECRELLCELLGGPDPSDVDAVLAALRKICAQSDHPID